MKRSDLSRREFLALASVFAGGAGFPARKAWAQEAAGGTVLRIQMDVPEFTDPRLFEQPESANILRGSNETLIRYRRDGRFEPWLLESWEVSEDASQYRLTLREGVLWSNGDPFTPEDVLFNIRRWCDAAVPGNSMASRMDALIDPETGALAEGVAEITRPREITLTLRKPDITLIASISDYPALLVHPSFDESGARIAENSIGTGPYDIEVTAGSRARLTKRASWWGGEVAVETIEYLDLGPDPSAQLDAFAAGRIDANYQSTGWFGPEFDAMGLKRSAITSGATIVCRVHRDATINGVKPYANRTLRRALAQMVDNGIVLEIGHGGRGLLAINAHVGPMHPDFARIDSLPYDPSGAMEAIYGTGFAEMTFTLTTLDDDWSRLSGDAIASQLQDAGLRVARSILPAGPFWENWRTHPFSVTEWSARPLGVQNLALAYRSHAAWNETGFASADFDAALDRALAIPDNFARREVMAELQTMLIEDGAIIQPYWRELSQHMRIGVTGMHIHPMLEHHHDLWQVAPA
ncbi:ABC transporter substrate-binding protein [Paracoccaceae bacterium GXU_MW_L88]